MALSDTDPNQDVTLAQDASKGGVPEQRLLKKTLVNGGVGGTTYVYIYIYGDRTGAIKPETLGLGIKELGIVHVSILRGAKEPRNLQNYRGGSAGN